MTRGEDERRSDAWLKFALSAAGVGTLMVVLGMVFILLTTEDGDANIGGGLVVLFGLGVLLAAAVACLAGIVLRVTRERDRAS